MPAAVRALACDVIGCLVWSTYPGRASDQYPVKPIKLLVGFAAGGPTDIPARFIAQKLSGVLGENVVVENKPGASGLVAARDMLSQPRDGYTLLFCTHYDPINSVFYKDAGYRLTDIAPVSLVSKYALTLMAVVTRAREDGRRDAERPARAAWTVQRLLAASPIRFREIPDRGDDGARAVGATAADAGFAGSRRRRW